MYEYLSLSSSRQNFVPLGILPHNPLQSKFSSHFHKVWQINWKGCIDWSCSNQRTKKKYWPSTIQYFAFFFNFSFFFGWKKNVKFCLDRLCLRYWNLEKGEADYITGTGHKSQVTKMCCRGDNVITCGIDDTVRFISVLEKKYKWVGSAVVAVILMM